MLNVLFGSFSFDFCLMFPYLLEHSSDSLVSDISVQIVRNKVQTISDLELYIPIILYLVMVCS